ncbi:MAG: class I SAM-dependent methyltransferase [Clostridiales bacterium]|jgi:23S rRNA (cytosine1962-C5)-methyltransferase|nr:class I SAM-dependent methyltransferase [Clostridiales bacterium]
MLITPDSWKDYELLDLHYGEKLERWGNIIVIRPDPQVIWQGDRNEAAWNNVHLQYHRSKSGGGKWERKKNIPDNWQIKWRNLTFLIRPTDFKHMGLFPEQAANWDWLTKTIKDCKTQPRILNLFAYTGGATVAAAKAGAHVTHVDAAKGMNQWAKENARLSGVPAENLRFITDDVMKFVQREQRRQHTYDGIIMDPPSYGRGPSGEIWKIEDKLYALVMSCSKLLSQPLFFLINSYTTGFSPIAAYNILYTLMYKKHGGEVSYGELGLNSKSKLILPCGIFAKWEKD